MFTLSIIKTKLVNCNVKLEAIKHICVLDIMAFHAFFQL